MDSSCKIRIWSSLEKSAHSLSLGRKENRRYHYDEEDDEFDDERQQALVPQKPKLTHESGGSIIGTNILNSQSTNTATQL